MPELTLRARYEDRAIRQRPDMIAHAMEEVFVFRDVRLITTAWDGYQKRFPQDRLELTQVDPSISELIPGKEYLLECPAEGECTVVKGPWLGGA